MKYLDEYRNSEIAQRLVERISAITTKKWTIMEVCGGQTHAIMKYGIDELLPKEIILLHGPGCPVCVTPPEYIDKALAIAKCENVILCSFGDMMRVPGSKESLLSAKASGADIRMVYSPLDAIRIARENPHHKVVFFAVGFETTAPTTALSVLQAKSLNLDNYYLLTSHVLVIPAMELVSLSPISNVQGFIAAGHVCTVTGWKVYEDFTARLSKPVVVTGFEPVDILDGIFHLILQLEQGRCEVENKYSRSVRPEGNLQARQMIDEVFEPEDREWRGIGKIKQSGLRLRTAYKQYDILEEISISNLPEHSASVCISGLILQGLKKPQDCPVFAKECTPEMPLGATMVSSEGACAAYYKFKRFTNGR